MRILVAGLLVCLCCVRDAAAAQSFEGLVRLSLGDQQIEGSPLAWDSSMVYLLGRGGRLWRFPPDDATDFSKTSTRFRSYSVSELRGELLRELGNRFEVTGTGHYLVAHPRGQRDIWPQRFEDLYRSFVHYFSVRGFEPKKPPYPLIGIVCGDQREFIRVAAGRGARVTSGLLGFYRPTSNQILLYDMQAGRDPKHWPRNASVILHEATHQTAFNTGIHSRYAPPPLWVAEGLATMFEAPGVYDSRYHTDRSDRVNRGRLGQFRQIVVAKHRPELLRSIVGCDDLFRTHTATAYAEAWALSFFLVETRPRQYTKYLALTADRPKFTEYTSAKRTADFTSVFGTNWSMLEARFLRFMADVK